MLIPLLAGALLTLAPAYASAGTGTAPSHARPLAGHAPPAVEHDRPALDPGIPAGAAHTAVTDTVIAVERGARLELDNRRGDVIVRTWDRAAVRIRADHDDDGRIDIERSGQVLRVRSRARRGAPGRIEYRIHVPEWMAVRLSGRSGDIDVAGVGGRVEAQTVQGGIRLVGAGGSVIVRSVQGEIEVEGARGGVEAHTVNDDIRIARSAGAVAAETVNGEIALDGLDSGSARASTVNGDITYHGAIRPDGHYRFITHNGDVSVAIPDGTDASVSVSTYNGEFETDIPVQLTNYRRGRQFSFVLGDGGAQVEIEAFQGEIRLYRPD